MSVTVIFDNFPGDRRYFIMLNEEDFEVIDQCWDTADYQLSSYSSLPLFDEVNVWADIPPNQYEFLSLKAMIDFYALTDDEQLNDNNPIVVALRFFVTGLVKCLETRAQFNIEILKLQYVNDCTMNFEILSSITMTLEPLDQKTKLKVVVDNTKKDTDD